MCTRGCIKGHKKYCSDKNSVTCEKKKKSDYFGGRTLFSVPFENVYEKTKMSYA